MRSRRTAARILVGLGRGLESWEVVRTRAPRYEDWEIWVESWLAEGREDVVWRAVASGASSFAAQQHHPAAIAMRLRRLRAAGDAAGLWDVFRDRFQSEEVRLAALRQLASLAGAAEFLLERTCTPQPWPALAALASLGDEAVVARIDALVERATNVQRGRLFYLLAVRGSPSAYAALGRWALHAEFGSEARAVLRSHPPHEEAELRLQKLQTP